MVDEATVTNALKHLTLSEVRPDGGGKELGRGAYGRVFTVKYCGRIFAAKEIHSILLEYSGKEERYAIRKSFLQECYHCSNLRHPNIVQFIGVYWPEHQSDLPVMVMELMECNLTTFVDKRPKCDRKIKYSILCDVAYGLVYLHAQKPIVIHRDLSPNNVLMTSQLVAKIGDLGVAKALRAGGKQIEKKTKLTKLPGTVDFMPPETFSDNPVYDTSLDVFSFGGITLFVMTEQWPTPSAATEFDSRTRQVIGLTEAKRRWVYLSQLDQEWRDLVENCLDNDPAQRPAISQVLEKIETFKEKLAKASSMGSQVDSKPYVKPRHHPVTPSGSEAPVCGKPIVKPRLSTPPTTPTPQHYSRAATSSKSAPLGFGEALQTGNYEIGWTRCTDLPDPMYGASVAGDNQNIYVAAGCAPNVDTYDKIFWYKIKNGRWSQLPSPGHNLGVLCMVDGKLNVFGGHNAVDKTATNKVSTLLPDTNSWIRHFPNMVNVRTKPGVAVYMEHIIVAGGARDKVNFNNDIEILNWQQPHLEWERVDVILPVPMWAMSLTISSDKVYIVGYTQAKGRSASVYQLPVTAILEQGFYSNESPTEYWVKLRSAPHHDTALVPGSDPPVIVGGNSHGLGTNDICVYSPSENCWKTCALLTSPRINVAVASVYDDSIIVVGGNTKGKTVELAMESTLTTVELGKLKSLKNTAILSKAASADDYQMKDFSGNKYNY